MLDNVRQPALGERLEDFAYDVLQAALLSGHFEPGARLNERGLAAAMGISRDPVRQAIKRLETEGFVNTIPRWGTHVREFTHEEYMQTFEVRQAIEVCAARRAALEMPDREIDNLRRIADAFLLPPSTPAPQALKNTKGRDLEFHTAVLKTCGNAMLWQLVGNFVPILTAYFGYEGLEVVQEDRERGSNPDYESKLHHEYVDALASRDADMAETEVRKHIARKWHHAKKVAERLHVNLEANAAPIDAERSAHGSMKS